MPSLKTSMTLPAVGADELLAALTRAGRAAPAVVDLRSPAEFAADHVPGAVNVPLFDDAERAVIGTLYRRESPAAAFAEGRRATLAHAAELVAGIARAAAWEVPAADLRARVARMTAGGVAKLEGALRAQALSGALAADAVVLHCWRGGLRSKSVIAFVRELGLERAVGLAGGYKAWRAAVRARLDAWQAPPTFVLRGFTGVGKTLVLRVLERLRPGWTVDLEALAGHRSSVLGMVGLQPCSQKAFETRLLMRLCADAPGFPGGVAVLEGESRKVGDAIQPERVWAALQGGVNVELTAPTEHRAAVLVADYLERPENRAELRAQLPFLEERLGPRKYAGALVGMLDAGRDAELAALLLELYYDPLYAHSEKGRAYAVTFDATDPARCAAGIAEWIEARNAAREAK
jgi:tRNA 2-selenouridine synthase